jgi:GntR family transcriptional repressor for pyruvate dehydrogenase complex
MFKTIETTSIVDAVILQLKAIILDGTLQPGDRFPSDSELCQQLGVSRTTIREAKKSLIGMGLLESRRGEGTFVQNNMLNALMDSIRLGLRVEKGAISELTEARRIVEVAAAGLAAERATPEDKIYLSTLVDEMRLAVLTGDMVAFRRVDLAWHMSIAGATLNRILIRMVETVHDVLEVFITTVLQVPSSAETALSAHERVTEAILAGDAVQAQAAMSTHLDEVQRLIALQVSLEE